MVPLALRGMSTKFARRAFQIAVHVLLHVLLHRLHLPTPEGLVISTAVSEAVESAALRAWRWWRSRPLTKRAISAPRA